MSAYDLVVIGSGPAGQRAAIAAAKLGWRVAVVERHPFAIVGPTEQELTGQGVPYEAGVSRFRALAGQISGYPTLAEAYKIAALDGLNRL